MSGLISSPRRTPLARLSPAIRNARLDADLWYADRIEHISRLLAQRAMRTGNAQDAATARYLITLGKRIGPASAWISREQELARKFGDAPTAEPSTPPADRTISNYVDLIASGTEDRKVEFQRWQNLIQDEPASFALRWGFARALAKSGRTAEAIRETKAALELDPGHFEARRLLAQQMFRNRDFESALKQIDTALRFRHDDISALRIRSILRLYAGHREELLSEIERMGEILNMDEEPEAAEARRIESEPAAKLADRVVSKEVLDTRTVERIRDLFPKDRDVRTLLVKKYYREKRFGEAIELMEQNAKSGQRTTLDLINLAMLYRSDFRTQKAIETGIELIQREDFGIWLNERKATSQFCFFLLKEVERTDARQAIELCKTLIIASSESKGSKGLWHYQLARIQLIVNGKSGIGESIQNLKIAGQQHDIYIKRWYANESAFDPYRSEIDPILNQFFGFLSSITPMKR